MIKILDKHPSELLDAVKMNSSFSKNADSAITEVYSIDLTPESIAFSKEKFKYNFGRMHDGEYVRVPENNFYYFKIFLNTTFVKTENDTVVLNNVWDRAKEEFPTSVIYVNGLKVPDKLIYIYTSETGTDLFIPESYLVDQPINEVLIEKREFGKLEYINYYVPSFTGTKIDLMLTKEEYDNTIINTDTILIFINGRLYTSAESVIQEGNKVSITLNNVSTAAKLELFIDSSVTYCYSKNLTNAVIPLFEIPEDYNDPINGPISKKSCIFFVDGKREQNSDITQIGLMNYSMPSETGVPRNIRTTVVVTDMGFIDDSSLMMYNKEYYLYNMIGVNGVTRKYNGEGDPQYLENINFDETLNDNGVKYNFDNLTALIDTYNQLTTNVTKLNFLLDQKLYLVRNFLNFFKKPVNAFMYSYTKVQAFVKLSLDLPDNITFDKDVCYEVTITTYDRYGKPSNYGKHVLATTIVRTIRGNTVTIEIPGSNFTLNSKHLVEVTVHSSILSGPRYVTLEPKDIRKENALTSAVFIPLNAFDTYSDLNDFSVYEYTTEAGYLYPFVDDGLNYGYKYRSDVIKSIDPKKGLKISFLNTKLPKSKFLVYMKRFVFNTNFKILDDIDTEKEIVFPLYFNDKNNFIPIVNIGKIDVYANDYKLLEGMDYFIKNMENSPAVAFSAIVFKRNILKNTEIDVYFTGIRNRTIMNLQDMQPNTNKYGLIYFGDSPFPLSPNYTELYLNGHRVPSTSIDIISDRLLRISKEYTPFYDIHLETTFSADYTELYDFVCNRTDVTLLDAPAELHSKVTKLPSGLFRTIDISKFRNTRIRIEFDWKTAANPASSEYLSVWVKNESLSWTNIETTTSAVYEHKIITINVPNIKAEKLLITFFNVFPTTVDFSSYVKNIKIYEERPVFRTAETSFENEIKNIFRAVDYSYDPSVGEEMPDVEDVYESFVTIVDSVNKAANLARTTGVILPTRYDVYKNAVIRWLIGTKTSTSINGDYLAESILKLFEVFKEDIEDENWDMVIDSSEVDMFSDITIDIKNYPTEISKMYSHLCAFIKDKVTTPKSLTQILEQYTTDIEAPNIIRVVDLLPLQSGQELDGEIDIVLGGI